MSSTLPFDKAKRLDACVARYVFKKSVSKNLLVTDQESFVIDFEGPVPSYSADIGLAWQVIDKLKEGGFSADIKCYGIEQESDCASLHCFMYSCYVYDRKGRYHCVGDSAQEAICLAALKSMDIDFEEVCM